MKTKFLLETDQISCSDESGNEINCHKSGQDGEFNRANLITTNRFHVINDIVEDRFTGLFWNKNANLPDFPLSWKEASEFIKEINTSKLSGIKKWRLPTRKELFSLLSHQFVNPSLPKGHPFNNVFHGYYWTQTECARLHNQAWYIHLGGGRVYRGMKHGSYMVWPVTGPLTNQDSVENRFIVNGNSFYDRATGKYWYSGIEFNDDAVTWKEAINSIKKLNGDRKVEYNDWRLPNIRELESLVDDKKHTPAFTSGHFFNKIQNGYWSSTTSLYEPRYAWVLYTKDGSIGVGYKPQADFFVCVVRG